MGLGLIGPFGEAVSQSMKTKQACLVGGCTRKGIGCGCAEEEQAGVDVIAWAIRCESPWERA